MLLLLKKYHSGLGFSKKCVISEYFIKISGSIQLLIPVTMKLSTSKTNF